MRKTLAALAAVATFGGAIVATAPAEARPYGGYHGGYYHHRSNAGPAIAAGVVGLALGAAIAGNANHGYYGGGGYYPRGYYSSGYAYPAYGYYDYGYRTCESRRWVYDPYIGRNVPVISRYAC